MKGKSWRRHCTGVICISSQHGSVNGQMLQWTKSFRWCTEITISIRFNFELKSRFSISIIVTSLPDTAPYCATAQPTESNMTIQQNTHKLSNLSHSLQSNAPKMLPFFLQNNHLLQINKFKVKTQAFSKYYFHLNSWIFYLPHIKITWLTIALETIQYSKSSIHNRSAAFCQLCSPTQQCSKASRVKMSAICPTTTTTTTTNLGPHFRNFLRFFLSSYLVLPKFGEIKIPK